jgi:hypothetical protein
MQMSEQVAAVRLGYVDGVTLTKWRTIWAERFPRDRMDVVEVAQPDQVAALLDGLVDLCFVRLPVPTENLHLIRLYDELPVAWVTKGHPVAADDEVTLADLADETILTTVDGPTIDLVVAGAGVLLVPQSVARGHSRRDMTYRVVTDAPSTTIGLAWRKDNPHALADEVVGIVRGRTANSSRSAREREGRPSTARSRDSSDGPNPSPSRASSAHRSSGRSTSGRSGRRRGRR